MASEKPLNAQLRLRVFAGPNESGKSTVIKSIRESESSGRLIDLGTYVNADDIACAESPEINKYRVLLRKTQGGHDVPTNKIESRYYASLSLLYRASQIAYQAFFFDNSTAEAPFQLIGHFKKTDGVKIWDTQCNADKRTWFEKYYVRGIILNRRRRHIKAACFASALPVYWFFNFIPFCRSRLPEGSAEGRTC